MSNNYYNVDKLLIETQGGEDRAKYEDHYYIEYSSDKRIYTKSYKVVI